MEKVGSEEGFDGMTDCVTKVDEIAQVCFLWIVRDDGCFGVYGRDDEGEEGVRSEIRERLSVYGFERVEEGGGGGFEEGKRVLIPYSGGLCGDEGERRLGGGDGPL